MFRSLPEANGVDDLVEVADELIWCHAVALALHQLGGEASVDTLIAHPLLVAKYASKPGITLRTRIWSTLGQHAVDGSATVKNQRRFGDKLFDKRPNKKSTWFLAAPLPEEVLEMAERLKTSTTSAVTPRENHTFVTFHQAYGYEDFIEGIRPNVGGSAEGEDEEKLSYSLEPGVFMRAIQAALRLAGYKGTLHELCGLTTKQRADIFDGKPRFALFIDEINRGNVSRIFGELITLLEDDKRLGEPNEIITWLPSSKKRFGIPPNLHVIGTMNTADRSVEALDTALRRRFEFQETPPRPELLKFSIDDEIDPAAMLQAINYRLERLYDRDHCIGHAYLIGLQEEPSLEGLKRVFRNKLIPLLQEYFFGDWGKIGLVLGEAFVEQHDTSKTGFAKFHHADRDALAERPTWRLADMAKITNRDFQRIYSDVAED